MNQIRIVALGQGNEEGLSLGALKAMKTAPALVLRTGVHGVTAYLKKEGLHFETLDDLYESSADFDSLNARACEKLLQMAKDQGLCYAVPDPLHDVSVRLLLKLGGDQVVLAPGLSLEAAICLNEKIEGPYVSAEASALEAVDAKRPLVVLELNSRILAGENKLKLLPVFGPKATVRFYKPGSGWPREAISICLEDLDRQARYDHTTAYLLRPAPLLEREAFDLMDLMEILRILRRKNGCAWDREQTHQSLIRYLLEEANEAASALSREDWPEAEDELGDVLLQVAFHAVIGEEFGTLSLEGITSDICQKLIRRHPHVFNQMRADNAQEALQNWDAIKKTEKAPQSDPLPFSTMMKAVPESFEALLRAEKVQQTAHKAHFDWPNAADALEKVFEEAKELKEALQDPEKAADELGDLLFSCVNVARLMKVSPQIALMKATEKFINRFSRMEAAIQKDEKSLPLLTIQESDVYWIRSKN